nr:serpin A3-1-like; partial [Biomphalaria glabrata]
MTSLGARGDTATGMKDVLGITSLGDSVHSIYGETVQQLNSQSQAQLLTGNAIFIKPSYPIVPEFIGNTIFINPSYLIVPELIQETANAGTLPCLIVAPVWKRPLEEVCRNCNRLNSDAASQQPSFSTGPGTPFLTKKTQESKIVDR